MRLLARLASLWRGLFRRARMDAELDEELGDLLRRPGRAPPGRGPAPRRSPARSRAARWAAPHVKAAVRESWLVSAWDAAAKTCARRGAGLAVTPGLSGLAVVTFALGIGSATAILGVVHATLLTPPPYRDPSRLVLVWADLTAAGHPRAPLSGPGAPGPAHAHDVASRASARSGRTASRSRHHGEPEFVRIGLVTAELLPRARRPAGGGTRSSSPQDDVEGRPRRSC